MKLIKRNYQAVVNRGLINEKTNIIDFIDKMEEEYFEVCNAHDIGENKPNDHMIEEVLDLMVVCINFLVHYNVNIIRGLIKIAWKNERRAHMNNSKFLKYGIRIQQEER